MSESPAFPEHDAEEVDYRPWALVASCIVGALAYGAASLLSFEHDPLPARRGAAIIGFMASSWLTRAMPLAATSLLPVALMPMLGVLPLGMSPKEGPGGDSLVYSAATSYMAPIIWMFFGGFVLARGIERWGLHRRIALSIIDRTGSRPKALVFGFMVASWFLSMWLLNTSVTLMLLPIGMAVVMGFGESEQIAGVRVQRFAVALLLGIAYASSIGGMATPVGTAPNALYFSNVEALPGGAELSFAQWVVASLPAALVMLPAAWWLLCRGEFPHLGSDELDRLKEARRNQLAMSSAEKRILMLLVLAAVLWMTRRDIQVGDFVVPGWWRLTPVPTAKYFADGSVAVFVCCLSFLVPSGLAKGQALMDWKHAKTIPWDILLLLGGGVAIAQAFSFTGLARAVGLSMEPFIRGTPLWLAVLAVCFLVIFLTELTSNTAMTAVFLPVLAQAGMSAGIDPRYLMYPATLAASCAFMLPIATPPNAIVFGSKMISMKTMARQGLSLNLVAVVVIALHAIFYASGVLGFG